MVGADRRFGACAGDLRAGKGLSRGMSPGMVAPPQKSFAGRVDCGFNLCNSLKVETKGVKMLWYNAGQKAQHVWDWAFVKLARMTDNEGALINTAIYLWR